MIDKLIAHFKRPASETKSEQPEGYCPNCWGNQEYDSVVRKMYQDKQVDINNHKANYSFIQDFVVENLEGIHLKKGDNGYECPTCKHVSPEK